MEVFKAGNVASNAKASQQQLKRGLGGRSSRCCVGKGLTQCLTAAATGAVRRCASAWFSTAVHNSWHEGLTDLSERSHAGKEEKSASWQRTCNVVDSILRRRILTGSLVDPRPSCATVIQLGVRQPSSLCTRSLANLCGPERLHNAVTACALERLLSLKEDLRPPVAYCCRRCIEQLHKPTLSLIAYTDVGQARWPRKVLRRPHPLALLSRSLGLLSRNLGLLGCSCR
jgi:hypothetical protein